MKRMDFQNWLIGIFCSALVVTALHTAVASNPDHVAAFKKTLQCPRCDLSNANLGGFQAPKANLTNADLRGASFYGGNLREADLSGAMLDGANLEMVDLTGAIGAVLGGARTDKRTTCPSGDPGPCS